MGRVYDVKPGAGELSGARRAVEWLNGRSGAACGRLSKVVRVELDDDADSGPATVTTYLTDAAGSPVINADGDSVVTVTFRARVRVLQPGVA